MCILLFHIGFGPVTAGRALVVTIYCLGQASLILLAQVLFIWLVGLLDFGAPSLKVQGNVATSRLFSFKIVYLCLIYDP